MVNTGSQQMNSTNIATPLTQGVNKNASFFNNNMQPTNSVLATKWHRTLDINDQVQTQRTPYSNPSFVMHHGLFILYNSTGGTVLTYNPSTGLIDYGVSASSFVKELQITLANGGANSGGPNYYYTNNQGTVPAPIISSQFTIDPNNYPGASFVLESVFFAGTVGQGTTTFNMQLYDITGGSAITNSTLTSSAQVGTGNNAVPPIVRGTQNFRTSLVGGSRQYMLQYWTGTFTTYVNMYTTRLIITY